MGRQRNPERDKSLKRYIEANGEISTKELAQLAGVPEARIRKWKSEDAWEEALKNKPKKRGGQKGNKNAAGKTPAKRGNKNAVTHGAFAQVGAEDLPPDVAEKICAMDSVRAMDEMMAELQSLYIRKAYLESLLQQYEAPEAQGFYVDKVVHMIVPKSLEEKMQEEDVGMESSVIDPEGTQTTETYKTAMKSIIKSSPFDRAMKVEAELNKLHGRIIKQLDSIKAYELEGQRMELERQRLELARQKITGEIDIKDDIEVIDGLESDGK